MKKIFAAIFLFMLILPTPTFAQNTGLKNSVNEISYEEKENFLTVIRACADIMRFDRNNYDYDTLMKYILCTHRNFAAVTDLSPEAGISGSDGISIVNGDYIDSVLTGVFKITPFHPPVNELVDRGYCYSNGLYYYKNIFSAYFSTQILELTELYSLGGGIYYMVFSDIYYENENSFPEYSFAVIQKNSSLPYSLIRLGMGEEPLEEAEIIAYTPQKTYEKPRWQTPPPEGTASKSDLPLLIALISAGGVILIIGGAALIRELTRK